MRDAVFLLACLACAGHGRRLQLSEGLLRSQEHVDEGSPNALVTLLTALNPAAAHTSSLPSMPRLQLQHQRNQHSQRSPAKQAPISQLLQMRGGENLGGIIANAYLGVPIFTRMWLSLMILCSLLCQVGVASPELLALDAKSIVIKKELWRPLTAMTFVGGVAAPLLQKGFNLVQFGRGLEMTLGFGEFARVMGSCAAMLCLLFNLLQWPFIADGLIMAMTVLVCQLNPTGKTNIYGINIPFVYLPFANMFLSYIFSQEIPWPDILGAIVAYINYHINDNLKSDADIWRRQAKQDKKLHGGGGSSKKGSSKRKPKAKIATFKNCDAGG